MRDFEVPNFGTNRFEKIRTDQVKKVAQETYSSRKALAKNPNNGQSDSFRCTIHRNGYITEDSNEEIYGLGSNASSLPGTNQFIDLSSELDSLTSDDQQRKSIPNIHIGRRARLSRLRGEAADQPAREPVREPAREQTREQTREQNREAVLKLIDSETESDQERRSNRMSQMVISKSIQLNSELESDHPDRSIDRLTNRGRTNRRPSNSAGEDREEELIGNKMSRTLISDEMSRRETFHSKASSKKSSPVIRLLELFEPYGNEPPIRQENSELDRIFKPHCESPFPPVSNCRTDAAHNYGGRNGHPIGSQPKSFSLRNDLHHDLRNDPRNHSTLTGKQELTYSQFAKHNPTKNLAKNPANQAGYCHDEPPNCRRHHSLKQDSQANIRQPNGMKRENNQKQSIMSPVLTANQLELPPQFQPPDKPVTSPQTNLFLHPHHLQPHNLNFHHQPNLAFYKQAETQRHFLVTFKHYYPEKCRWAFIVLCCVCLVHSLQFVFQMEHLFIIDSSVHFNSSLTLSGNVYYTLYSRYLSAI